MIDVEDTSAIARFDDLDYARRWNRRVNAPTEDDVVHITATIGWTDTLVGLALQRMHVGFCAEAATLGRRIERPILHYAPGPGHSVSSCLEDGASIYGPVTIPAVAALASELSFQVHSALIAPFYLRYADARDIPLNTEIETRPSH